MSAIDGSRLLSALTLPGSHDTCAYTIGADNASLPV
jgi:1-phosphatidylinositol phosphodiesterase